ncbi:MAG: hypothetical protein CMI79_02385 [Candidatus Pelagibacter sp.]|nr:hypothetical protein [Candidatus Pelagibacter sp.]|tara:strand:+ start:449 stop:1852 length:1404 start_codon:yes stop_codon:yes gene_type:complete
MIFKSSYKKKSIAVFDPIKKNTMSYADLLEEKNKKIYRGKKSLILILAENSVGFIATYFSYIQNEHTIMILGSQANTEYINDTIKRFNPHIIALENNFKINKIKFKINKIHSINNYNIFKTNFKKKYKINKNILLLLGTSGSTGNKKWVKLSKKNLISNLYSITKELNITQNDITITTLPPEYTYGLSIINSHLFSGAKIILNNLSVIQKNFWTSLKKNKITNFGGVPYVYEILDRINFKQYLTGTKLKHITQAGGKLNKDLHKKINSICEEKNINFYVMYGSTETSPRMTVLKDVGKNKKFDSIGKAILNTKIWIEKDQKKVTQPFIKGEIVFQGQNIFGGYASNQNDLKNFKNIKSFLTGDLGYYDKQGFFYVVGRKSRFLKIKGLRINLEETESKLKNKLSFECRVTGKDENLNVYIIKNVKNITEIKRSISKILSIHPSDINVKIIKNFPKTVSGKIKYSELK